VCVCVCLSLSVGYWNVKLKAVTLEAPCNTFLRGRAGVVQPEGATRRLALQVSACFLTHTHTHIHTHTHRDRHFSSVFVCLLLTK